MVTRLRIIARRAKPDECLVGLVYQLPAYALFFLGPASMAGIPFSIQDCAERGPSTEPLWVVLPSLE